MTILAIFNAKGGVAKTTSTVNLAACFAAMGKRVLVVDLDYQGNATRSLGFAELPRSGSYELITARHPVDALRHDTFIAGLSLVGATNSLAAVDVEMALKDSGHDLLRRLLAACADVDIILLDCPPAMGVLTLNALVSCNAVLIPSPPEHFAHDGLLRTWSLVTRIRGELNPGLEILGILPTLLDPAPTQPEDGVLALMRSEFGSRVGREGIPREDRLFDQAAAYGVPACIYDPDSAASRAYLRTAAQLLGVDGAQVSALRRLDDDAPDAHALAESGLKGLHRAREAATRADLLDAPVNLPPTSPDPAPLDFDPGPVETSNGLSASKVAALTLLVGVTGFVAGWLAAINLP